ncbi:hypothetical protein N2152v2_005655 [Parachlorella kessleri]
MLCLQGYREDDGLLLESDTDEQLLIHIPFNQKVKLTSIVIKSTGKPEQAPRKIKLFVNRPTIGFGEAADLAGQHEFELTEKELGGEPVQLKVVKFNNVNVLTVFVESNQEDEDTTVVQKIALFGSAGDSFNMADFKDISKEQNQ